MPLGPQLAAGSPEVPAAGCPPPKAARHQLLWQCRWSRCRQLRQQGALLPDWQQGGRMMVSGQRPVQHPEQVALGGQPAQIAVDGTGSRFSKLGQVLAGYDRGLSS